MKPFARPLWGALGGALLFLTFAVVAGCTVSATDSQNCVPTPCGAGSTLNVCTKEDSSHVCVGITYEVGSQSFACNSCLDCATAQSQAAQACNGIGPGDGGGGDGSGGDGGNTNCATANACGNHGTYQECTTLATDGSCKSIEYKTSDGHTFMCSSCSSCQGAASQLATYCAGTGGDVTTCGSTVSCGSNGLTYQQCTTSSDGVCVSVAYDVSNGAAYDCASCGDCSSAVTQLNAFCASQGNSTTSCASSIACGSGGLTYSECTTTSATGVCQSVAYEVSNGVAYTCASCSDCTTAYDDTYSYCASQSTSTSCGSATTCGVNGVTYSVCTTSTGSTCDSIAYEATDGTTYDCASCADCTLASEDMSSYCSSMSQTTSCGSAVTCGTTGVTYSVCTTSSGSTCDSIAYEATNGVVYDCASCSDCSTASADMTSYCASLDTTTSCGTAVACGVTGLFTYSVCTTYTNNVCTGIEYEATTGVDYACASCTDCSTASTDMINYCATSGL
jgi:hypothetical protein